MNNPTQRLRRCLTLVVLSALATGSLTACGGNKSNDSKIATAGLPNVLENLTANPWRLDPGSSSIIIPGAGPITIVFGAAHVLTGTEACGNYHATFTLDESTIAIENLRRTKRKCSALDEAAAHQYFKTLALVHHVQPTSRDRLRLTGGSKVALVYKARTFSEP